MEYKNKELVEIVVFPDGKVKNPQNFTEKTFKGSIPQIIKQTMDFFSTNILYETVEKVSGKQEANRYWNYPYDALEEAVVNSLFITEIMPSTNPWRLPLSLKEYPY